MGWETDEAAKFQNLTFWSKSLLAHIAHAHRELMTGEMLKK